MFTFKKKKQHNKSVIMSDDIGQSKHISLDYEGTSFISWIILAETLEAISASQAVIR